jgi:hypothetical protein
VRWIVTSLTTCMLIGAPAFLSGDCVRVELPLHEVVKYQTRSWFYGADILTATPTVRNQDPIGRLDDATATVATDAAPSAQRRPL